jgi:hypothetical protein
MVLKEITTQLPMVLKEMCDSLLMVDFGTPRALVILLFEL